MAPAPRRSDPPAARATPSGRGARRKHRTRERLLDAALDVFVARGYDGATTSAIARAADLGAGTFYCHFRDKRAAFEGIAHGAARTVMERWTAAVDPGMPLARSVSLALEISAAYWREHPARARLLLEDGPSFGTAAHLRLVDDFGGALRARWSDDRGTRIGPAEARALGALVVGLAIEIGRLVLGNDPRQDARAVRRLIDFAQRALATSAD